MDDLIPLCRECHAFIHDYQAALYRGDQIEMIVNQRVFVAPVDIHSVKLEASIAAVTALHSNDSNRIRRP